MIPQTKLFQQYFSLRETQPGVLLAMRVGDFYEFYGDDAVTAAAALEITLTGKEDGSNGRIPMAGVPYFSVEKYLARLVAQGHKVALGEQVEDPKLAKGLVARKITRVLTPGTVLEDSMLPARTNNYLCAIVVLEKGWGLATLDPSTGEFATTENSTLGSTSLGASDQSRERLLQELARLKPSELICPPGTKDVAEQLQAAIGFSLTERRLLSPERCQTILKERFRVAQLDGFGIANKLASCEACAMILDYADSIHLQLDYLQPPISYSIDEFMRLDPSTRRALELTANMVDGSKKYTLWEVLDQTETVMGGRFLKRMIEQPLIDAEEINSRQDAVERFYRHPEARGDFRAQLKTLHDIERLVSRTVNNLASPRDLVALKASLLALPMLDEPLRLVGLGRIQELREKIGDHRALAHDLRLALFDEPPATLRDGGVIRAGHDVELDQLRDLATDGRAYIAKLESEERSKTGINNLKVGYNSVFGYFLEVAKGQTGKVPDHYIRKQTTANAERYITAELKDHESVVLGARDKALQLEAELFNRLRLKVAKEAETLMATAGAIAELDAVSTLAEVAIRNRYVRPEIISENVLEVAMARHPMVEKNKEHFVPNNLMMESDLGRIHIITGPNMAGKSTFLRQNAMVVIMAQIGSFVPANSCRMGICDRIFARIGARDELALGQSTFMVEMVESAHILNHATADSLVILDEVGRGTSTFDGLAIAWAMVEEIVGIGAKTLFATHYHQLNALADETAAVKNFRVAIEEHGDEIVWTHRVLPGGTDKSYGIHVARMAGVPNSVLLRSAELLAELEGRPAEIKPSGFKSLDTKRMQLSLFEAEDPEVLKQLKALNVNHLTPLEALQVLDDWKRKFGKS